MNPTETHQKLPLWRRRGVRIAALAIGIPALALAWWLGSPLFLNKTVVEAFPVAETPTAVVAEVEADSATETVASDADVTSNDESGSDETATAESAAPQTPATPVEIASGGFAGADASHEGSGDVAVFELEDGSRILRFEGLDVTNGPDLHVILTNVAQPEDRDDVMSDGYVDLGKLKGNRGDQNYEIPADFDVSGDISVIIYCVPFHVIFATATLS